jgi:hypothetical protein
MPSDPPDDGAEINHIKSIIYSMRAHTQALESRLKAEQEMVHRLYEMSEEALKAIETRQRRQSAPEIPGDPESSEDSGPPDEND